MNRILKANERLRRFSKPPLDVITRLELPPRSALVLCAGFEDRCTAALEDLLSSGQRDLRVVVVEYEPHIPQNRAEYIRQACETSGIRPSTVTYSRSAREASGEIILKELIDVPGEIVIDISGMSRFLIVQLVVALRRWTRGYHRVSLFYAEARAYPPRESDVNQVLEASEDEFERARMFISSHVYDVCIVPELSSTALPGQPIRSVVFPSFNPYQLAAMTELQPTWFTIIHGVPPRIENRWRTAAIRRLNQIDRLLRREEVETSTLEYRETLNCLLDVYDKHGQLARIVVSPTGSKMQSVAVGILRAFLDDVQIVYPTPLRYAAPKDVTTGVQDRHLLRMDRYLEALADSACADGGTGCD